MKVSKNLKWFTVINLLSSILFFTFLSKGIFVSQVEGEANTYVSYLPTIYGLVWFVSGLIFAGTDKVRNSRFNLGLAYHLASTVVVIIAMVYAFLLFEVFRTVGFVVFPLLAMAVSLLIHWLATRNNPKGIDKKEAFK